MNGEIILHNAAAATWLKFKSPVRVISARAIDEVLPALREIENGVNEQGLHAAGFISYEAAAAFDSALVTHPAKFPLLWFGLYRQPEEIRLPAPDYSAYSLGEASPAETEEHYGQAIEKIKEYIHAGDTYQVNYTLRLRLPFSGDPWQLFLAMLRAQSPGYAAWIDTEQYAICSASPELFFRLDGGLIECKPMKGTVKRGRTLEEDQQFAEWLRSSEKNRAENLMILDMIRNDLGRVASMGSVSVPSMFDVERHPTLWQMTSTAAAMSDRSIAEIFAALFPCASITGAPKVRTSQIIAELETTPRGLYTGCIGFIAPDRKAQFSVAIRTAVLDKDSDIVEYGVGGGIVWDSESDDEYEEALLKSRVLKEQLPEFSLLETMLWTPKMSYFLLEYHLKRLERSADYFDFKADVDAIKKSLLEKASGFGEDKWRVRLLLSKDGTFETQAVPLGESPLPMRIKLADKPVQSNDVFLYHKTTQRSVYESARKEAPGFDDVLLYNERGELTESTIANIVIEMDGVLLTPPIESGLLGGVFRAWLLDRHMIKEQTLRIEDLNSCTNIYLVNSVRRWQHASLET